MPNHCAPSKTDTDALWATQELAHTKLPDQRLVQRLITMATDFASHPTASIPQACGDWAKTKAAYRFFDNDTVKPQAILDAHVQATVQRMQAHPFVLCAQDTTSLNYSTHPQTKGLGPISNNRDKTIGLLLHSTLAVLPCGQSLGLLHARSWARCPRTFGRDSNTRNRTPRKEKESQKWLDSFVACQALAPLCPQTTLVNVADREGDLYDLFQQALAPTDAPPVHLLVRAQHDRQVNHPQKYLWDFLADQPVKAQIHIQVPRKEGQPARQATLAISFAPVTLRPPCLKEEQKPLTLWSVLARELHPPQGVQAICWRLLTTLPVPTIESAVEKVRWYACRWQIEVMHKVLKSGCKIEQRQLETATRLQRVLMVDLIVAWRVLNLCHAARQTPDASCQQWLDPLEWRALWCYTHQSSKPPTQAPTVGQAVRWIAQLGGFLGRRHDGQPGVIVLWRGLQQLRAITAAWIRFGHHKNCG